MPADVQALEFLVAVACLNPHDFCPHSAVWELWRGSVKSDCIGLHTIFSWNSMSKGTCALSREVGPSLSPSGPSRLGGGGQQPTSSTCSPASRPPARRWCTSSWRGERAAGRHPGDGLRRHDEGRDHRPRRPLRHLLRGPDLLRREGGGPSFGETPIVWAVPRTARPRMIRWPVGSRPRDRTEHPACASCGRSCLAGPPASSVQD
jgi:hypothetical protein